MLGTDVRRALSFFANAGSLHLCTVSILHLLGKRVGCAIAYSGRRFLWSWQLVEVSHQHNARSFSAVCHMA